MKIDATREGGAVILRLGGRLEREWAEHLSSTLDELLRQGVRTLTLDLSHVTYISSAATKVLTRWQQELALLRGEVQLTALSPAVRDMFAVTGWDGSLKANGGSSGPNLRQSSWHQRTGFATSGQYQMSSSEPEGTLTCHLHGRPAQLGRTPFRSADCEVVEFPPTRFGIGLGAIAGEYGDGCERVGELVAVSGSIAYFPSDGARLPDYLVGEGPTAPRALLATGLTCEGGFSKLLRFNPQPDADSVPLSELAAVCLDASGSKVAGLVIAGETAGLSGARLLQSPAAAQAEPLRFDLPGVRDWLSFAPERTYPVATTLIAGVIARTPEGALASHLRPFGITGKLFGHFHAAVFSYHPLPQRTVELDALTKGLFANHQLRDVLHLVWDDRAEAAVAESALVRGVAWVAPITQIS
jgi:anti-sigma B factor antagonist